MFEWNAGFGVVRGVISGVIPGANWQAHPRGGARLRLAALGALALLAGCQTTPSGQRGPTTQTPALPSDDGRHRVALLVPLTGANAGAGQSLANATTMALLDTNAQNLRITTYDTGFSAPAAAARAIADGNQLILGPLLGDDALAVANSAKAAHVPVISFSNDATVAGDNVWVMGNIPGQSVARVVRYARSQGAMRFAALIPVGAYGTRASGAMLDAVRDTGGVLVGMEGYERSEGAMAAAVRRLKAHGAVDAVLVADSAPAAAEAAALLVKPGVPGPRILGTELWRGEALVAHTPALDGALFAALSDARFHRFADSYKARFGTAPYRIATLGYDGVLLTLRIARDWRPDAPFPTARLFDRDGFLGLDGAFRFGSGEVIERSLEVREVRGGTVTVVSPAPSRFGE